MVTEARERTQSRLEVNRHVAVERLGNYLQRPEERILREHQVDAMDSLRTHFQAGETAGYINLPTGSGKSVIVAELAEALGMRTLVLSPTLQILDQTGLAAKRFTPELRVTERHGKSKDTSGVVVNTTYQSLESAISRREIDPADFDFLICDEVHTALGPKRHKLFQHFPHALMVGLTATPFFTQLESYKRKDPDRAGERWTAMFEKSIHDMSLEEGIERGILANLDVNIVRTGVRVGSIRTTSSGEYNEEDLARYLNVWVRNSITVGLIAGVDKIPAEAEITPRTRDEIERVHNQIKGKKTAIFGIDINHIQELSRALTLAGQRVRVVHGRLSPDDRKRVFKEYEDGNVDVLLGVDLIRLGWDSPATEVGIYLAPTRSGVVATQELGRILRTSPEKGKAIAVQLVDLFEGRGQSPVLIPNLFDPYFVLRGSVVYGESSPRSSKDDNGISRPKVRFSGIGIEAIVEEARSQELLRQRINKADIDELDRFTADLAISVYSENPGISPIEFYRKFAEELPYRIGANVQEKALQAIANIDSNVAIAGKRVLLSLGIRFALTAADRYFTGDPDIDSDMLHAGFLTFFDEVENYKRKTASRPVQDLVEKGVIEFVSQRENIPATLVRNGKYRQIKQAALEYILAPNTRNRYTVVEEIAERFGEDSRAVGGYVNYLIALRDGPIRETESEVVGEEAFNTMRGEAIRDAVSSLGDPRMIDVIKLRFGFGDGEEMTLKQVGLELQPPVTPERVRQIEAKALRRLRHPYRARKLKGFVEEKSFLYVSPDQLAGPLKREKEMERFRARHEHMMARLGLRGETAMMRAIEEDLRLRPLEERTWHFVRDGTGVVVIGISKEIETETMEFIKLIEVMRKFLYESEQGRVVFDLSLFRLKNSILRSVDDNFDPNERRKIYIADSDNSSKPTVEDILNGISYRHLNPMIISDIDDVLEYLPEEVRSQIPGLGGGGRRLRLSLPRNV